MLTAGDALAKTLVKSQKVTFWSQKKAFNVFFFANRWRCSKSCLVIAFRNCILLSKIKITRKPLVFNYIYIKKYLYF